MSIALRRLSTLATASSLALMLSLSSSPAAQAADKSVPRATSKAASGAKAEALLVKVEGAWIRATVKGQSGTGGFMDLTASQDLTLVGFATPVAGESDLHEMVMDGGVMRMRSVDALPLPAGQTVNLRPGMGGHHLMLMSLKQQLNDGDEVPLTLKLRTADGKIVTQELKVQVKGGSMTMPSQGPACGAAAASAAGCGQGMSGAGQGMRRHGMRPGMMSGPGASSAQ